MLSVCSVVKSDLRISGAVLIGLAALEVAWLGWFLVEPLPNAANVGGRVVRWAVLAQGGAGVRAGDRGSTGRTSA